MDLTTHLRTHFEEGIELRQRMAQSLPGDIARAGRALAAALKSGHKALACGNGGSAADSQHFETTRFMTFRSRRQTTPHGTSARVKGPSSGRPSLKRCQ